MWSSELFTYKNNLSPTPSLNIFPSLSQPPAPHRSNCLSAVGHGDLVTNGGALALVTDDLGRVTLLLPRLPVASCAPPYDPYNDSTTSTMIWLSPPRRLSSCLQP
jgi:hypothetical protein